MELMASATNLGWLDIAWEVAVLVWLATIEARLREKGDDGRDGPGDHLGDGHEGCGDADSDRMVFEATPGPDE